MAREISDTTLQDWRDRVEPTGAVECEAEAAQVLIAHHDAPVRASDLQLEIAEPVERIRPAAGGDAAAVLRPRRRVLNVPELAVARRNARDRVDAASNRYRGGREDAAASEGAHRGSLLV